MISELQQLEESALAELETARTEDQFLLVKTKYIGRKGLLTGLLETLLRFPMLKNLYSENSAMN